MTSVDYILQLAEDLKISFESRNDRHQTIQDHRTRNIDVYIPAKFKDATSYNITPYKSPLIADTIRRMVSILAASIPIPKRHPLSDSQKNLEISSLIEEWFTSALRMGKASVFTKFIDSFVAAGIGVYEVTRDKHAWGGLKKGESESADSFNERVKLHHKMYFPFNIKNVHPSTFYPVGDGVSEAIVITKRRAMPVARHYGLKIVDGKFALGNIEDSGSDWPKTVNYIEYWNEDEYVYIVEDYVVDRGKHDYGRTPFFYAPASLTYDLSDQGLSYVEYLVPLQEALNEAVTAYKAWAQLNAFPFFISETVDEAGMVFRNTGEEVIEIVPGGVVDVPLGKRLSPMAIPPIGQELTGLIQFLMEQSKSISLATILEGVFPGADLSGTALTTVIAVAKSIFAPGIRHIENMYSDIAAFMLREIDLNMKDQAVPVRITRKKKVDWIEISTKEIDGYYDVEFSMSPLLPAEQYQDFIVTSAAYNLKAATMRELIESRGVEDPERVIKERIKEDVLNSPQFWNWVLGKTLERLEGEVVPPPAMSTPANPPISPGGPGVPVVPGVGRDLAPNLPVRAV